jgi:hypothetical protein
MWIRIVVFSDVTPSSVVVTDVSEELTARPSTPFLKGVAACFSEILAKPCHNQTTHESSTSCSLNLHSLKFFVTFLSPSALILTQFQENWCSYHYVPFSIPTSMHITTSHTFDITSETNILRDFRLPPPCSWGLRSSGMLRSVDWQLVTEVSGQPIGPIFRTEPKGYRVTSQTSEDLLLSSWKHSWIFRW